MTGFRIFLVAIFIIIAVYTALVVANHGLTLFSVFFGDMAKMNWPGQFNLDFFGFLLLSGIWMAWRNQFTPAGLALGVCAVFGGMPLLAAYLLYLSFQTDGDVKVMLLGSERVSD